MINKKIILMAPLLLLLVIAIGNNTSFKRVYGELNVAQFEQEPSGYVLVKDGNITKQDVAQLYIVVKNPTTFNLINLSFYILLPLEAEIVSNITTIETYLTVTPIEEGKNLSISVPIIPKNTTYILTLYLKFSKTGVYYIDASDISCIKKKGELQENISIKMNNVIISVQEKSKNYYPQEGTTDITFGILIMTILPIIILAISNKIAWKMH